MEMLPESLQYLKDKIAITTGASRGIGKATALALASVGAKVVVNYARSSEAAAAVVQTIVDAGGKAIAIQADVSQPEEVDALIKETLAKYSRIDVLVNNAGITKDTLVMRMKLEQ